MRQSARSTLAIVLAGTLAACSLAGGGMWSDAPAIHIFRYQQVWLTPDERRLAQCWNGGALICSGGMGRLSTMLCECPE